jgi:uncharacterized protein (TIGR00251 family)
LKVIRCSERDGEIVFTVRVVPRASRSGVAGEHDGALRVRVAAPPVDGAANAELVRFLARLFNVPLRDVEITSGQASKLKQIRVRGAACEQLEKLAATG